MSRRSRAREIVLQVLYQDDMNPDQPEDIRQRFINARLNHDKALVEFAEVLLAGVRLNRENVDAQLEDRAAEERPGGHTRGLGDQRCEGR